MSAKFLKYFSILFLLGMIVGSVILYRLIPVSDSYTITFPGSTGTDWEAPDINKLPATAEADMIRYGKDLIENTSVFFGPKGAIAKISNGMDCKNCHIDAGMRLYGNSLGAVAATYPKYRDRSGRMESIEFRINECMERSLNGQSIDSVGKEMQAMVAYLKWLGKDVPKGIKPAGTGIPEISFLDRAADTVSGREIYIAKCLNCHGANGEGLLKGDSSGFFYPPLWGSDSYNVSAGLFRITRFAAFVKYNMPYNNLYNDPPLTDEEAWDVAAFVNSQPRTIKFFNYDWADVQAKPLDYPFGPFADSFNSVQHKYGPFKGMKTPKSGAKKYAGK